MRGERALGYGMRVAVIEDQALMREYLAALVRKHLGANEVIAIGSMAELRSREREFAGVGLTIFDIDLGDGSTIDWAVDRSQKSDGGALVALSSIPGSFPFKKLQASGISLVHKNDSEAELVEVLRQALGGSVILSRRIMNLISSAGRDPHSPIKLLGSREQQVLGLLGQRLSNEEIAELLGCAPSTVADHRKRIMRKLDLHRIEEVIDYAIRHGMVHDSMASGARSGIKR